MTENITDKRKPLLACDVIIACGNDCLVALSYIENEMEAPKVWFKYRGCMTRWFRKIAGILRIPVIENKILAKSLYMNICRNQEIERKYYEFVVNIYRGLRRMGYHWKVGSKKTKSGSGSVCKNLQKWSPHCLWRNSCN